MNFMDYKFRLYANCTQTYGSANLGSSWHMCSTVRVGKDDDKGACVDTDFRVRGVENLRVVDLSVIPLCPK